MLHHNPAGPEPTIMVVTSSFHFAPPFFLSPQGGEEHDDEKK
jgi:hypothetical protein